MIHARKDYNESIQDLSGRIPSDEPVFLIRGQDIVGHQAVRAWAHFHRLNGGSDTVYEIAMRHADKMEAWPKKKSADVPPEGTVHEGRLARELLARHEAARGQAADPWDDFEGYLRTVLARATRNVKCPCGYVYPVSGECPMVGRHEEIAAERRDRFPYGTVIYYNAWAYEENCRGVVRGRSRRWNWIRIKFDHLNTVRMCPVYDYDGWHISTEPLTGDTLRLRRI